MGTGPVSSPVPGAVSRGCQSCLGVPFSRNAPEELISFQNFGKRQVGMISLERRCFYPATSPQEPEHRPGLSVLIDGRSLDPKLDLFRL